MIRIITDSSSDIDAETAKKLNIDVIPLQVTFDGVSYVDGVDITTEEFYSKLKKCKDLPTTSQVNPAKFEKVFSEYVEKGDTIIGIFLASSLSGTYQSACIARDIVGGDIYIIDSKTVTLALAVLVREAASMRDEGVSAEKITEKITALTDKIRIIALVDTLKYLKKGGRISGTTAVIGGLLNISPIVQVENGVIDSIGKIRGTKGFPKFLDEYFVKHPIDENYYVGYGHADCPNEAENLRNKFPKGRSFISPIGSIVGTHSGPGAFGIAYIEK